MREDLPNHRDLVREPLVQINWYFLLIVTFNSRIKLHSKQQKPSLDGIIQRIQWAVLPIQCVSWAYLILNDEWTIFKIMRSYKKRLIVIFSSDRASGTSTDWVFAKQNVNLTYTFEFRDTGKNDHLSQLININYNILLFSYWWIGHYGSLLPAFKIIPNSLEVIDGLVAMVKEAKALQYL